MGIAIIATIHKKNKHIGYRIFDTSSTQASDVTVESVKNFLKSGKKLMNASIDKLDRVTGINCNITDLPKINIDYPMGHAKYVDKPKHLLILERTKSNAFIVVNYGGKCTSLFESNLKDYRNYLINTTPIVDTFTKNRQEEQKRLAEQAKKQANDGNATKSSEGDVNRLNEIHKDAGIAHNGKGYAPIDREKLFEQDKQFRKEQIEAALKKKEQKEQRNKMFEAIQSANTIQGNGGSIDAGNELRQAILNLRSVDDNIDTLIDSRSGLTVNQKLTQCVLTLKDIRIFYFSIYTAIQTLFVEDKTLMPTAGVSVDKMYINTNFFNDLILPEANFLLQHELLHIVLKHSLRGKGKNRDVFNIAGDLYINKLLTDEYGCEPGKGIVKIDGDSLNTGICFLDGGLWSKSVDVDKDTVESIYEELMQDIQDKIKKKKQSGQGKDNKGNGGKGSQKGKGTSGNNGSNSGSSDGSEDDENQDGQNGQGGGQSNKEKPDGNNQVSEVTCNDDKLDVEEVEFRGQKIGVKFNRDVVASSDDMKSDKDQLEQKANRVLQKASMAAKLAGKPISGFMERYVELELAPKIRWQNLLKHYLVASMNKVTTYARPDKRFISRGQIFPGPKPLDPDRINGIKICIDTSGSIDDHDISIALGQVDQILKTYKADAEVIYWDTSVRNVGDFTNRRELLKVIPKGGGGTDINCVFEYFDSKDCKVKPKVVLIFTDGYFGTLDPRYVNKYRNNIWIVPEQDRVNFKAPNGKVAIY